MQHNPNKSDLDILAGKIASRIAVSITPPPRWMDLKTAAHYSGFGQKKLIQLATQKKIYGFQDMETGTKPWRFDQFSIDAYRLSQGHTDWTDDEQVVAGIMAGVDI